MDTETPADASTEQLEQAIENSHPSEPAALRANAAQMFRYSAYLHVGPGAEECEHREDGQCGNAAHMHAWCRLPNKFQHRDLYAKATAAKARRMRLLDQEESDAREVLESELDTFKDGAHTETVIDDLLRVEWAKDYIEASKQVGEQEEYEHIEQDRERFMALGNTQLELADEAQSEEFRELAKHIGEWSRDVKAKLDEIQEPKRQAMRELGLEQLIDQLRRQRMKQITDELYLHVYNQWEWFVCTMKVTPHPVTGRPSERYWAEMGTLEDPTPGSMWDECAEVIDALQVTYDKLERDLQGGVSGNS